MRLRVARPAHQELASIRDTPLVWAVEAAPVPEVTVLGSGAVKLAALFRRGRCEPLSRTRGPFLGQPSRFPVHSGP